MTLVVGDRKLNVRCTHTGCGNTVAQKLSKATPASVRTKAVAQGWTVGAEGDYCPDHGPHSGQGTVAHRVDV